MCRGEPCLASLPEKAQVLGALPRGLVNSWSVCLLFATGWREAARVRQRDLDWVLSVSLRFPVSQAYACGPLVPDRQLSPRQEMSRYKERPPLLSHFRVRLPPLAFRAQWGRAWRSVTLSAKTGRLFHCKAVPGQRVRALGTEARSWVGIPAFPLAVLWPQPGLCKPLFSCLKNGASLPAPSPQPPAPGWV